MSSFSTRWRAEMCRGSSRWRAGVLMGALLVSGARAECPADVEAAAVAAAIVNRTPVHAVPGLTRMEDGLCGRDKVVRFLAQAWGAPVGHKAGLTNPAVQQRFGYGAPLRGRLFRAGLLPDGAQVPAAFGIRPVFEADLLVEVADPHALARAGSPDAALQALSAVIPFVELPDLMVGDPGALSGPMLALVNVGARLGVQGTPVPARSGGLRAEALASMTVSVRDGTGAVLDSAQGSAILGHPLNAAIWLARDLAAAGTPLQRGDLLSLGSFSRLLAPKSGLDIVVRYDGLPGNPEVRVHFR
ncbi:MAG TPA: hypothetical protein PLH85_00665 [Rhodocyclaceae bacterium]|nr:hypothetical protein [Rhodocyclaceae bacterium]